MPQPQGHLGPSSELYTTEKQLPSTIDASGAGQQQYSLGRKQTDCKKKNG